MTRIESLSHQSDDVVVIAEAGVNHNGRVDLAHQLIDVAAAAGADYVKFQTFVPDKLVAPTAPAARYQRERGANLGQSELLKSLALPDSAWAGLRDHAGELGIGFLSTPFDIDSALLLEGLGVDALKVSSGELTNHPFLRAIAALGVPMLLSTGMGTLDECRAATQICSPAPFLGLLHCVSAYPAPEEDCNLSAIPAMEKSLGVPVGWSDHSPGLTTAIVAATLGARLFEKHFTLDRGLPGPDHAASLEPAQLADYVQLVKSVPRLLGDGRKRRMPSEEENARLVRRSWHAARDLPAGTVLTLDDVVPLRPEGGVSPTVDLAGSVLRTAVSSGQPIVAAAVGLP